MKGTRWNNLLRECAGNIHREVKITLCRVPHPDKWVFIAGCYNSGTTLLRKILGSHPLISSLESEGQYLTDQFPSDHEIGLSRMWVKREDMYRLNEADTGPDATRIKKEWGMRLDRSKPIFLEQTPANAARTRWLQKNFENAYFIGIIRNGYAVVEGITRKANPIHSIDGWTIEEAAYQWRRSNEILREDSKYLDHFIWCRYEEFTERPDIEIERICKFLEIASNHGMNLDKNWSVHERDQKIRNMNNESITRLSSEHISRINLIMEKMMQYFSYNVIQDD